MHFPGTDQWLREHGQQVTAQITNVTGTENILHESKGLYAGNINVAANAYVVTAVWTDERTNHMYTFEKRCMSDHPPAYKEGGTIAVFIDPENPERYVMDIGC